MFNDYQALFLLWQKIKFTILIMLRVQFCGIKKKKPTHFYLILAPGIEWAPYNGNAEV